MISSKIILVGDKIAHLTTNIGSSDVNIETIEDNFDKFDITASSGTGECVIDIEEF